MARRMLEELEIEREFEEKVEGKRRRQPVRDYRPHGQELRRERKKQKAPALLRFLAWCGVILFCFVVGYTSTGKLAEQFGFFDKILQQPSGTGENGTGQGAPLAEEITGSQAAKFDIQKATFSVFYPRGTELASENVDVISRTLEDNIEEAARHILKLSGMGDTVDVLHVFRDVDLLYMDLSSAFPGVLAQAGKETATLLMNGIVRTMNENFSLARVRFLVDSKPAGRTDPVDLSAVWQIQR